MTVPFLQYNRAVVFFLSTTTCVIVDRFLVIVTPDYSFGQIRGCNAAAKSVMIMRLGQG